MSSNAEISSRISSPSQRQIRRMAEIVACYFPDLELMEQTVRNHVQHADTVRIAYRNERIVGFSIASKYSMLTPFYHRPVNVMFQRMLYLDPDVLYQGVGIKLLATTMRDLFGWLWPFRRIVAFCRTQNPVVARFMNMYSVAYPQYNRVLPEEIRQFAESLLPLLGAESLDDKFRIVGSLETFRGADYTDTWNRYLHHQDSEYESLMLHSAFRLQNDRIINSGAFVLMIAYARPLNFIPYLIRKGCT